MPFFMAKPSWPAIRFMAFTSMLLCGGLWYLTTWGNVMTRLRFSGSPTSSRFSHPETNLLSNDSVEPSPHVQGHPVERLMDKAQKRFDALTSGESHTLAEAARNYRKRRGRHPPPGFDAWYNLARSHNALIIEPFFDQIEADLSPLRGTDPHILRQTAHAFSPKITIRNGTIAAKKESLYEKLAQTASMLRVLAAQKEVRLPDLDIPINVNDEPAMLVPWETIDTALQFAKQVLTPYKETITDFAPIKDAEFPPLKFDPEWLHGRERHTAAPWLGALPFWSLVRPSCPPGSPTRDQPLMQDIWHREGHTKEEHLASALLPLRLPSGTYEGYTQNSSSALDVCQHPSWQGLHGAFVAPTGMSVTQKLFPLFSTSKIAVSNEILIPNAGDWNVSNQTSDRTIPWSEKKDKLYWRGPATGGKNIASNWQRFHRHRFVAMLNATHVEIAEALTHAGNESIIGLGYARNFRLLPANDYQLNTQRGARMAEWVNSWGDAIFTDLQCDESTEDGTCPYTDQYFSIAPLNSSIPKDTMGKYRYSAILDGEGADENGSFTSSLRSGQLALKASIYRQWYDNRVLPWLHFVPLDTTYVDLYAVMEFFRGSQATGNGKEFAHAHIEIEKHEHHFNTPPSKRRRRVIRETFRAKEDSGSDSEQDSSSDDITGDSLDGNADKAQRIAEAGQEWTSRALRKEDVLIYVYRLLLEYARIKDDRRELLGWVGDLLEEDGKKGAQT